jgi:eukaryotic-like serine/threonine-protein kinase
VPEPVPDPLVGQVLAGRYRILAKLGEGAMGAVYVGEHLHIGRHDAIKLLRPGLAGDAEAIARFTRGTRNVSAIRHPNVCAIYDFSDTPEGFRYLAMEYIEGETLKELLDREGRLEPARAVAIARQVADALQAAHDAGVIHRDLKPGNIMICRGRDDAEVVKVVDFDIAKGSAEAEDAEVTRLGFVVGTPEYMSPEQLTGDRLDGRSDLYSLGVVLFRMLAGTLPFRAANTQEIMVQRLTGEPLRLDEVLPPGAAPPQLQQALDRALARRAEDRQASVGEFGREIGAAVDGRAAGMPPDGLAATHVGPRPPLPARASAAPMTGGASAGAARTVPSTGFRRAPLAVAAIVAVLVLAAAGAAVMLRDRAPPEIARGPTDPPIERLPVLTTNGADDDVADDDVADPRSPDPAPLRPNTTQPEDVTVARPPAGGVSAMLDRQLEALGDPATSAAAMRAVRDSASLGWRLATTRSDSASAAFVLAQAALLANDLAECGSWARRGARLQPSAAFESLIEACRQ